MVFHGFPYIKPIFSMVFHGSIVSCCLFPHENDACLVTRCTEAGPFAIRSPKDDSRAEVKCIHFPLSISCLWVGYNYII